MVAQHGTVETIDFDKTIVTLEPDKPCDGGLQLPGKDRVVFKPHEGKSLLGLDVLANVKRESKGNGAFKVPKERPFSAMTFTEEDDKSSSSGLDEVDTESPSIGKSHSGRHYRGNTVQDSPYT
ncbi:Pre-mrna-splicing factor atp-dependent rna helicase, partial [Thalictrum thalictroides]